jgi:hypothetical protein
MRLFTSWWHRAPGGVQITLSLLSIVAVVLGGSAGHYWQ